MIVDDDAYNAHFLKIEMEMVLEKFNLPLKLIDQGFDGESAV